MSASAAKPARRTSARWAEVLFAAAVAAIAVVAFALVQASGAAADGSHAIATVSRHGTVVQTIDLAAVEAPYTLRLEDESGWNTVAVEPGRIRIVEADCPDKVCVETGWVDGPGRPIACAPHGLTITVECEGGGPDDVDAIAR